MVMKTLASVVVLVALAGVASADQVRVNYDYAATGIDEGQGMWSVTIDSGLIPDGVDANGIAQYLDPNTAVTFIAPMATPVFTQRDALLEGDVIPDIAGLAGWTNDGTNRGKNAGMSWVFYGPNDVVTLYGITEGYIQYSFTVQTILKNEGGDGGTAEVRNGYRWAFNLADNPDGIDYADVGQLRTVSYYGNVGATTTTEEGDVVGASNGHRHTGNRWRNDDEWGPGQQVARSGQTGLLGGDANGDGIGVSLGVRVISNDDAPGTASIFFYNVVIGGDVFGDTDTITTTPGVL